VGATADDEFRDFMRGRWPAMVRLAYGLTGDLGHAEDVAQAAFARAYASWGRVTRTGDPDAYLRRIVVNENHRRFRKRRVAEVLPGELPERGVPGGAPEPHSELLSALRRLGPRQRAVIVLRYWMDMPEGDIAATLGCSVGTVKSQAARALAILRRDSALAGGDLEDASRAGDFRASFLEARDIVEGGPR
jgi:RNA polymerase sigma-70 factor (sigma-E family)